MFKSSKPKNEKPSSKSINVGGNVSNSVLIAGDKNKVTVQIGQVKTTYGLFTIPQSVTDFTGRERELMQLKESFSHGAIITGVSGAGGIGKTELARKLAHDIANNYPDAQISIDLQGTFEKPLSSEDAMRRLLEPFFIGQKLPNDESQLKGLYQQTFGTKKVLLLLDNAANAPQVRPLIPPAPSAAIITSRQHFSLNEFGLHEPLRLDVLSPEKAREFLRSASPKLNNSPDEDVNGLAKLCGYLPLALRVVASLLNDRSDWIASHLIKRLADERTRLQQLKREDDVNLDVDAALSLSYGLLGDDLKKRFRELGVFTAPFAKVSAKAVLAIENDNELDDILGKLMGRSLLNHQKSQEIVQNLYFMHDLTRLYATQKLFEGKEYKVSFSRYAEHFFNMAARSNKLYLMGNENVLQGLAEFRFIWVHLYPIYERLLPDQMAFPPQFADSLLSFFPKVCAFVLEAYLPPHQLIPILTNALRAAQRLNDKDTEGVHLGNLGTAYLHIGEPKKALEFIEQDLVIRRQLGDRKGECIDVGNLGYAYIALGDHRKSIEFFTNAIVIAQEVNDLRDEGNYVSGIGGAYHRMGKFEDAIEFFERGLNIDRDLGDLRGEVSDLSSIGQAYLALRDGYKAIEFYKKAVEINRDLADPRFGGSLFGGLGEAYLALSEFQKAIESFEEALKIDQELGNHKEVIRWLEKIAYAYMTLGFSYTNMSNYQLAISYYEKGLAISRETNNRGGECVALGCIGEAYDRSGDTRKGIGYYKQALEVARGLGDKIKEGNSLFSLGLAYEALGDKERAIEFIALALAIFQVVGSPHTQQAILHLATLRGAPQNANESQIVMSSFIHEAIQSAISNNSSEISKYSEMVTKWSRDSNAPAEIHELAKVLRWILSGFMRPDLSRLPDNLATMIRRELNK